MTVTMKNLLEAGVHFGHQTRRWNPKMKPYIFTERNGIYILNLQRTLRELDQAYRFARRVAAEGGSVLFVGTKKQAQEPIAREAARAGMPYVNERWLGGMLTNWVTVRTRVARMVQLEQMDESGALEALPKKEASHLRTELAKLRRNLDGIRNMNTLPSAVFIVDTKREEIAVAEARRLSIPIIGLVDTNADPDDVDFVIPGNDDAIRAVNLMTTVIADAVAEGRAKLEGEQNAPAPQPAAAAPETAAPQDAPAEPLAAEAAADVVAPEEPVAVEAQAPMDAEVSADVVAEA